MSAANGGDGMIGPMVVWSDGLGIYIGPVEGDPVADVVVEENAIEIVKRWNAHGTLIAALQRIVDITGSTRGRVSLVDEFKDIARLALAEAA